MPIPSRVVVLLSAAVALVYACGGGDGKRDYPVDFADDALPLEEMALKQSDMPERGLQEVFSESFTNEEWAAAYESQVSDVSADQRLIQLDAQGRVLNHLTLYSWDNPVEHLGRIQQIESHSTIYEDEEAASNAMRFHACGLLIGDDQPLDQFEVPALANESTGFFREQTIDPLGKFIDTVVCFRTGRVLHAVVQNGLDGTQDSALSVDLAKKMLAYVNDAFDTEESNSEGS